MPTVGAQGRALSPSSPASHLIGVDTPLTRSASARAGPETVRARRVAPTGRRAPSIKRQAAINGPHLAPTRAPVLLTALGPRLNGLQLGTSLTSVAVTTTPRTVVVPTRVPRAGIRAPGASLRAGTLPLGLFRPSSPTTSTAKLPRQGPCPRSPTPKPPLCLPTAPRVPRQYGAATTAQLNVEPLVPTRVPPVLVGSPAQPTRRP